MKRMWLLWVILLLGVRPVVSAPVDRFWGVRPDALTSMYPQLLVPGEYTFQECKQVEADFFACSLVVSEDISLSVMSVSKASSIDAVILNCFCEFPAYSKYALELMRAATGMEETRLEAFWLELGEKNNIVNERMVFSVYRDNGAYVLMIALNK